MSFKRNFSSHNDSRGGAPQAVARAVRGIAEKALGKAGQSLAQLLTHWPQIVGPEMAHRCLPTAMNFPKGKNADAVLHLATNSADALELSYQIPVLRERVNAFLGYSAVADIRLDHKQLRQSEFKVVSGAFRGGGGHANRVPAPVVADQSAVPAEVCEIYSDIKDPELRARLEALCLAVARAS